MPITINSVIVNHTGLEYGYRGVGSILIVTGTFSGLERTPVGIGSYGVALRVSIPSLDLTSSTIYEGISTNPTSPTSGEFTIQINISAANTSSGTGSTTLIPVRVEQPSGIASSLWTVQFRNVNVVFKRGTTHTTGVSGKWTDVVTIPTLTGGTPPGGYDWTNTYTSSVTGRTVTAGTSQTMSYLMNAHRENSPVYNQNITKKTYSIGFSSDPKNTVQGSVSPSTYQGESYSQTRTITAYPERPGNTRGNIFLSRSGESGGPAPTISGDTITIPAGSYGDIVLAPVWTEVWPGTTYNVSYAFGTGISAAGDLITGGNTSSYTASKTVSRQIKFAFRVTSGYNYTGMSYQYIGFNGETVITLGTPTPFMDGYESITNLPTSTWGDIRISVSASIITYNLTYQNLQGATHTNPSSYNVTTNTITLSAPTSRTGYTFGGWYNNSNFTGSPVTSITKGSTGHRTLYAKWDPIKYTISYTLNDSTTYPVKGSNPNPLEYDIEQGVIFSQGSLIRNGYDFAGFSPTSIPQGSTGDKTTVLSWTAKTFNINLNADGGTGFYSSFNSYNTNNTNGTSYQVTLTRPTKPGYTFDKYTITRSSSGGPTPTISGDTLTIPSGSYGNITIKANWTANTNTVTFTGASIESLSWTTSTSTGLFMFTVPPKTGYSISSVLITQNTSGGTSSVEVSSGSTYALTIPANAYGNIVIAVAYTPNSYTVSFDANGGTAVADKILLYDAQIGTLGITTKGGYNFVGWFTANEGGNQVSPTDININGGLNNTTIYARWSAKVLTINYNAGGGTGTMSSNSGSYDGTVTVKANSFTKTGYTFSHWTNSDTEANVQNINENTTYNVNDLSSQLGTTNATGLSITLTAQWTINSYDVIFDSVGGSAVATITQDYLSSVAKPADPTRPGWIFGGWYTDSNYTTLQAWPFNMPLGGKTLYARWSGDTYNIIVDMNGGVGQSDTNYIVSATEVTYTNKFNPVTKTVEGKKHSFSHWEITQNLTNGDAIINGRDLTIPAEAYGELKIKARWTVANRKIRIGTTRFEENKIRFGASGESVAKVIYIDSDENEEVLFENEEVLEE